MPKLTIDGNEIEVENGLTVLQACEIAGKEIPRFCYHERLEIAGNCRMCLVEMEKSPKPIASCAMPVAEGMVIKTNTENVKKAREGVMEFLLINHPLDCPICDQAGECDLQDQALFYGRGGSRFHENKRAVPEKDFGPLIKAEMTRCIHCTRCVRFSELVAGVEELGGLYRGENMEIGTYVEKAVSSELSGNMIDLCPVGALTSKPYAFKARNWELKKVESIDVLDAIGSNIRVDVRGVEVMRILPRLNEDVNEEWISDKTRFAYDGLSLQRIDRPFVRKNGKLVPSTWEEAYRTIASKLKGEKAQKVAALVGDLADCESITVLRDIMNVIGVEHIDSRQEGEKFDVSDRSSYLFNTTISGIEKADFCLLIGVNPRKDAAVLNARIRKRALKPGFSVAHLGGGELDLTYKSQNLGDDIAVLNEILAGKHSICKILEKSRNPMVILGIDAVSRPDGLALIELVKKIASKYNMIQEDWNGFNVLHRAASRVGALDLGVVPGKTGKNFHEILAAAEEGEISFLYLLGVDEANLKNYKKCFVVYQGHHGDRGAHIADVVLPGSAYTEKNGTYVNLEGRVQRARKAAPAPGMAKEDWLILKELADALGCKLAYNDFEHLRKRMFQIAPHFAMVGDIMKASWSANDKLLELDSSVKLEVKNYNFYMTDPISRNSKTMAKCSELFNGRVE